LPQAESGPGSWRFGHGLVIGVILLVAVLAGWWTRAPEVGVGGDEATYVILSRSLAQGRYRDESLLGAPPHAKYPPGMPAWIGAIQAVSGPGLDGVRAANLLLLALTALLIGDAVRRLSGPWPGAAAVALTAFSPGLLEFAGMALSEVPFTFLVAGSLWLTLRFNGDPRPGGIAAAMAAAVAGFLVRSAGITAVAGVLAWLVVRRRLRSGWIAVLVSALAIAGWFAYTALAGPASDTGSSYGRDLSEVASTGPGGFAGLLMQGTNNARLYLLALPESLGVPTIPGTPIDNLLWLVVLLACGSVGLLALLRRWPAAAVHLLLSAAVLVVWPWPVIRLMIPMLPLIGAALLLGSFALAGRIGPTAQTIVPLVFAALLSSSGLVAHLARDTNHECNRRNPYDDPACFSPGNRNMVWAARLIRDSAPPGTVVATGRPAAVHYFSGRPTLSLSALRRSAGESGTPDPAIIWVLLSDLNSRERSAARRLRELGCERFEVRARAPRVVLLVPRASPAGPGADACAALQELVPGSGG
jgi:4-amino-4-deoxy-L-arabinose transferase-like glycosyltransferase